MQRQLDQIDIKRPTWMQQPQLNRNGGGDNAAAQRTAQRQQPMKTTQGRVEVLTKGDFIK
jgi:hypothetical protein